jgi:murein DD-endopeptidase MepM/ murein hydrolase activator NlpD
MVSPYKGDFKVTQIFKGENHKGIDLVGISSKNIYVPEDSDIVVDFVGMDRHPTGGMGLYIRGKRTKDGLYSYFAHLSKTVVEVDHLIRAGELLGVEGSTGHSTGSHLHYEIRKRAGNNMSFVDIASFCGIPNKLGTYKGGNSIEEQADEMVAELKRMITITKPLELRAELIKNQNSSMWWVIKKIIDTRR